MYLSIYLSAFLQPWKRSYSARLPQFVNLTTSKTKQFCETSSTFERYNVKNEAILRDFFNFRSWHSAGFPSKMESWERCRARLDPNTCQRECQNICQKVCQNRCQIECQIECQAECQNICQVECQIECRNICPIECEKECKTERQNLCQIKYQKECLNRIPERMSK